MDLCYEIMLWYENMWMAWQLSQIQILSHLNTHNYLDTNQVRKLYTRSISIVQAWVWRINDLK